MSDNPHTYQIVPYQAHMDIASGDATKNNMDMVRERCPLVSYEIGGTDMDVIASGTSPRSNNRERMSPSREELREIECQIRRARSEYGYELTEDTSRWLSGVAPGVVGDRRFLCPVYTGFSDSSLCP